MDLDEKKIEKSQDKYIDALEKIIENQKRSLILSRLTVIFLLAIIVIKLFVIG